jgi:protein O-GlcNAc transferase
MKMLASTMTQSIAQAEKLFRAGRLDEMESVCASILQNTSGSNGTAAEAHRFLGLAGYTRGELAQAEDHVRRAIQLAPGDGPAHDNLSLILCAMGKHSEAEAAARQAIALQPSLANAALNLGIALRKQERFSEAEHPHRSAIALDPLNAELWNHLAAVLEKLRRAPEALAALQRAIELRPDFQLARENRDRLQRQSIPEAGKLACDQGSILLSENHLEEAEALFRRAIFFNPDLPDAVLNLAKVLLLKHQYAEAEKLLLQARDQRPDSADVFYHLGLACMALRKLSEAEAAYVRCTELDPGHFRALRNLGAGVLNAEGRIDEARAAYQRALDLRPGNSACHSNQLFNESYAPGVSLAGLAKLHAAWEGKHAASLRPTWRPFTNTRDPDRPLRLGFVSGDLYLHPVGLFLEPVLKRLDGDNWFTVFYDNRDRGDKQTELLKSHAGLWRKVNEQSDESLAQQIRDDGIDLLFDLSGHTAGARLLAIARRPAPVQLTWMGYVGATGLAAIDYLIADRFHVPPGSEMHYSEKILRLPDGYLCYVAPDYAPAVGPLPAMSVGHVTFGSFNNTAKINPTVIAVWAQILRRVPNSRLVLKYHWLDDAGLRRRLTDLFAAESITPDRLELLGNTTHFEQLQQYNCIDLALDTFPYSGGLTTCEAVWMGVPVVTCPGETFASRHSLSHLSNIGMTETIVGNYADYVETAVHLASDLPRLADLRSSLRARMSGSPLCDADRFTANLAGSLRNLWRVWCG